MAGSSPIVKTRLKDPMHARFVAEMEKRKLSESELLRLALTHFFEGTASNSEKVPASEEISATLIEPAPELAGLERTTIWMPAFLMNAVRERAAAKGTTFSRWISALVQSNLMRYPVLMEAELQAVEASTRELAAIGRNINQIARVLNESFFQTERVRIDKLAELSAQISKTREAIATLVRASRNVWRAD